MRSSPIFEAVAYPAHVFWVPIPVALMAFFFWSAISVVFINSLFGLGVFSGVIGYLVTHGYVAVRFRRDPFVYGEWKARIWCGGPLARAASRSAGRPAVPGRAGRTRGLFAGGNRYTV